ncbi:unnamed protein product [Paramecium sonneborni]|uniref:Metalloendopeptidase n=1 Tax=Paramecium sonneborni TaxID=65129 RepID=A0A8S1QZB6_9CILI|nr:unnamed protein product [Paramecium sonneborni]
MDSNSSNQIHKCVTIDDYIDNFSNQYSNQSKPITQQCQYNAGRNQIDTLKNYTVAAGNYYYSFPQQNFHSQITSTKQSLKLADWVWPGGIIPYIIDKSFTHKMRYNLQQAIQEFQNKTPIRFVNISDEQQYNQYVKYYRNKENASYVLWIGRSLKEREHAVYINENFTYGTYLHETMHILGFDHEQCRQDRDNYVTVQFSELDSHNLRFQYQKRGFMIGEYDPYSIMHYYLNRNMTSKDQYKYITFGQSTCLSDGDIKGIQLVYGKSQCTYDVYGDKYMEQDYFECITCWGSDSIYGACRACGITCHNGHKLILKKSKSFFCDCGRQNHKIQQQFQNYIYEPRKQLSEVDFKVNQQVYRCTFDIYGDKYITQDYFECITCWGPSSVYGACNTCAITCHNGHELIYKKSQPFVTFVCDCGRYNHKNQLCTRQATQFKRVQQLMYLCYDCFDIVHYQYNHNGNIPGVCHPCAMKCHKNHNLRFYMLAFNFFCDCGLEDCQKICIAI